MKRMMEVGVLANLCLHLPDAVKWDWTQTSLAINLKVSVHGFHSFSLWTVVWDQVKTGEEDLHDRAILTVETSVSRDAVFSFWLPLVISLLKCKDKTLVHWCLNRLDLMKPVLLLRISIYLCPRVRVTKWISSFRTQFLTLAIQKFWAKKSFNLGNWAVHYKMFSLSPGLHPTRCQ